MSWIPINETSLIIGILAFLCTLILGITALCWNRRAPKLLFFQDIIQTKNHPKLTITYEGQEIDNLVGVRLAYWNHGHTEMRVEDIPKEGGPRIVFPGDARILSIETEPSDPSTAANLVCDPLLPAVVKIEFEYLNRFDGLRARILYTTDSQSLSNPPRLEGAIKGAGTPSVRQFQPPHNPYLYLWVTLALWFFIVILVGFCQRILQVGVPSFRASVFLAMLATGGIVALHLRRRLPRWVSEWFGRQSMRESMLDFLDRFF